MLAICIGGEGLRCLGIFLHPSLFSSSTFLTFHRSQLGNNRGNKYSRKSTRSSPSSTTFWNFSIDEFAFYDIPDTIDYVLATTHQSSLSYVGFSQGTAQAFATLSIHPTLNDKVDVFVALAPAMSPAGLRHSVVDALIKSSPEVLFLAFGRRSMLSSATMWQSILYPPIFVRIIDTSLSFLFNWHSRNIAPHQKLAAYPHLYSYTSTRSVVHWFQIIRNRSFQMFDDDAQTSITLSARDRFYKVAKFPTRNIKTPVLLVYGGSDSLVDINVMLNELPRNTVAKEVPHFEHLDFLWANDVDKLVFPHVFEALEQYAGRERFDDRFSKSPEQDRRDLLKITDRGDEEGDDDHQEDRFWTSSAADEIGTDNDNSPTTTKPLATSIIAKKDKKPTLFQSAFGRTSRNHRSEPDPPRPRSKDNSDILPSPHSLATSLDDTAHSEQEYSSTQQPPGSSRGRRELQPPSSSSVLAPVHHASQKRKRDGSAVSVRSLQETSFAENGIRLGSSRATLGGIT